MPSRGGDLIWREKEEQSSRFSLWFPFSFFLTRLRGVGRSKDSKMSSSSLSSSMTTTEEEEEEEEEEGFRFLVVEEVFDEECKGFFRILFTGGLNSSSDENPNEREELFERSVLFEKRSVDFLEEEEDEDEEEEKEEEGGGSQRRRSLLLLWPASPIIPKNYLLWGASGQWAGISPNKNFFVVFLLVLLCFVCFV